VSEAGLVSGAADSDRLRGAARISRCVNKGSACSTFPNSWPSADRPDPDLALDSADRRSDLCKTVLFGGEEADGHRLRPDSDANAARARYRAGDHGRAAAGGNRGARAAGGVSGGVGRAAESSGGPTARRRHGAAAEQGPVRQLLADGNAVTRTGVVHAVADMVTQLRRGPAGNESWPRRLTLPFDVLRGVVIQPTPPCRSPCGP
jgi:hypothetical protein